MYIDFIFTHTSYDLELRSSAWPDSLETQFPFILLFFHSLEYWLKLGPTMSMFYFV